MIRTKGLECRKCGSVLRDGSARCLDCGAWNVLGGSRTKTHKALPLSAIEQKLVERLHTGPWDNVYGGGLVRTSVYLLGGQPGAGKSTFLLQLCDRLVDENTSAVYIATEESPEEIKARADRLGLKLQQNILMISALDDTDDSISTLDGVLESVTPAVLIVDSLQGLTSGDYSASLETLKKIKSRCVKHRCPGIVISHITKGGDYAGFMTFQHAVDCLLTLSVDHNGIRTLRTEKNRNGPAPAECALRMTEQGLITG